MPPELQVTGNDANKRNAVCNLEIAISPVAALLVIFRPYVTDFSQRRLSLRLGTLLRSAGAGVCASAARLPPLHRGHQHRGDVHHRGRRRLRHRPGHGEP